MRIPAVLAAFLLLLAPAAAQGPADARFAAAAYQQIPSQAVFQIDLLDNSDLNTRLLADFKQILADLGHGAGPDGSFELTFVTEEITDIIDYDAPGIFSLHIDTGSGLDPNTKAQGGTQSRTRLWSTTRDSLFARHGTIGAGQPLLRMEVEIRDVTDRPRVVWVARAEAPLLRSDRYRLFRQMVPTILENLGTTVPEQAIALY